MIVWRPGESLDDLERRVILAALAYFGWNQEETARRLGITSRTIRNKLNRYGLLPLPAHQKGTPGRKPSL